MIHSYYQQDEENKDIHQYQIIPSIKYIFNKIQCPLNKFNSLSTTKNSGFNEKWEFSCVNQKDRGGNLLRDHYNIASNFSLTITTTTTANGIITITFHSTSPAINTKEASKEAEKRVRSLSWLPQHQRKQQQKTHPYLHMAAAIALVYQSLQWPDWAQQSGSIHTLKKSDKSELTKQNDLSDSPVPLYSSQLSKPLEPLASSEQNNLSKLSGESEEKGIMKIKENRSQHQTKSNKEINKRNKT